MSSALYGLREVQFGADYLIPFPFDPRVLLWIAPAVAWAAVASGVAKEFIDLDQYREQLEVRLGRARGVMRGLDQPRDEQSQARRVPRRAKSRRSFAPRASASKTASRIPFSSAIARRSKKRRGR